jgi:hypothetical protein
MATESVSNAEDERLSDEELAELADFAPCFDDAAMERIEEIASSKAIGQNRRCMLVILARDADTSSDFSISEPEAFGEMRECVEAYRDHAKQMLEMAETACIRLAIADCRPEIAE